MEGKVAYEQSANQQLGLMKRGIERFVLAPDAQTAVRFMPDIADELEVFAKRDKFVQRRLRVGARNAVFGDGFECRRGCQWNSGLIPTQYRPRLT